MHPRHLFALTLVILAALKTHCVFAQAPKPAPRTVTKIVDDAVVEVRKNRRIFDDANREVLADAEKKLNEELKRLMAAGPAKLNDANATVATIRTLAETVTTRADAPMPLAIASPPPMEKWVIGKWTGANTPHIIGFIEGGRFEEIGKTAETPNIFGTWKSFRHGYIDVDVENGNQWEIRRCGPNAMAVVVTNPQKKQQGDGIVLLRVLDPVVGTWKWFNEGEHEFCGDGQITGFVGASWTAVDPTKRGYMVKWGDGKHVDMLFLSADGTRLEGKNDKGVKVSAERIR
jgi:hypothetical protein